MANRSRTNPVQFYLDDDEQYILDEKFKQSGMYKVILKYVQKILNKNVQML